MEKGNMNKTKIAPQVFAALSGTIILMSSGYHFGWASPMLPKLLEDTSIPVTPSQGSWIVSLMMIGSFIGPLISLPIVDKWGRKKSMLLLSLPFFISCILFAFARNYWWYYAGRFMGGIALGAGYTIIPIYMGEIADDKVRGGLGILLTVMLNFGFLIPYCAGPWLSTQVVAALGAVIPVVYVLVFTWMPETPYYHTMKNEPDNARKSLEWLRGTTDVKEELDRIRKTVEFDLKNRGTLKELFTDEGNRKALLIIVGLFSGQQISGNAAILSYTTVIFDEVASGVSSSVSVIITGVVQLVVSILVFFLADRAGRRTLLMLSMFLCAIFLTGEGVYFHLQANGMDVSVISWLPVSAIIGYLCSFTLGIGTLPIALISEIFPCNVKAYATTIGMLYLSLIAAFVSQLYPLISAAYGIHVAFYIFAIGSIFFTLFIFIYLPETRGKSLAEIQDILHRRSESKSKLEEISTSPSNSINCIATVNVPEFGTITLN